MTTTVSYFLSACLSHLTLNTQSTAHTRGGVATGNDKRWLSTK